jgi:acetyltransferase-like isoleucine patch superfamily enzyme
MNFRTLIRKALAKEHAQNKYFVSGAYSIHDSALLSEGFSIVHQVPAESRTYVNVRESCILQCTIIFESTSGSVSIGANTFIGGGTRLISIDSIEIGNDVMVAWDVTIYDHDGHSLIWEERRNDVRNAYRQLTSNPKANLKDWSTVARKGIRVGDRCWIGFGSVILKGVALGDGVVVGARSVVTKSFPPNVVIAGNPARVIKDVGLSR